MATDSLPFSLPKNDFISLLFLKVVICGYWILGQQFFPFCNLEILCHFPLASTTSDEKSSNSNQFLLKLSFLLAAFQIIVVSLWLWVDFHYDGLLWPSWIYRFKFFTRFEISNHYFSNHFFQHHTFSCPSGILDGTNITHFIIALQVSKFLLMVLLYFPNLFLVFQIKFS